MVRLDSYGRVKLGVNLRTPSESRPADTECEKLFKSGLKHSMSSGAISTSSLPVTKAPCTQC